MTTDTQIQMPIHGYTALLLTAAAESSTETINTKAIPSTGPNFALQIEVRSSAGQVTCQYTTPYLFVSAAEALQAYTDVMKQANEMVQSEIDRGALYRKVNGQPVLTRS